MHGTYLNAGAAVLAAISPLFAEGCGPDVPAPGAPKKRGAPAVVAEPCVPKDTIVTARLETPIVAGKNVLWCATFQLAWNELMDYAGGPVTMRTPPPLLKALNRRPFTKADLKDESYAAVAGLMGEGTMEKARRQMARRFPDRTPRLLPAAEALPPDGVMMFAFLAKHLPFEHPFQRHDGVRFSSDPEFEGAKRIRVADFGIRYYSPQDEEERKQARQVRVLSHEFLRTEQGIDQHFVIELLTAAENDRLILAQVPREETLGATISKVMKRVRSPNTATLDASDGEEEQLAALRMPVEECSKYASLLPLENLRVPVIDLDVCREYRELYGQSVIADNPRVNGLPFVFARQTIRFRLGRTGAELESEALGGLFGGPPRRFYFHRPFLVLLVQRNASRPYFALWIGNAELLEKMASPPEEPTVDRSTTEPAE